MRKIINGSTCLAIFTKKNFHYIYSSAHLIFDGRSLCKNFCMRIKILSTPQLIPLNTFKKKITIDVITKFSKFQSKKLLSLIFIKLNNWIVTQFVLKLNSVEKNQSLISNKIFSKKYFPKKCCPKNYIPKK